MTDTPSTEQTTDIHPFTVDVTQDELDDLQRRLECHAIYMSIDDSLRRIANQAFFDKLYLTPENTIDGDPGTPFNVLFNPDVHAAALRYHEHAADSRTQTGDVVGLNNDLLVGPDGFEPPTLAV